MATGKKDISKQKKVDDSTVVKQQWARYSRARDSGHSDYLKRAQRYDRFYRGEQWDDKDLAKLKEQGRPALTINTILPTINTVMGEQSSKRAGLGFRVRRNGDPKVAAALGKLSMQILDDNDFNYVESEVFADGLIQDRGFYDIRMGFEDHMLGDIDIKGLDPQDVILDPDAREYDPATWSEVFISRWLSLDDIASIYGEDKAKALTSSVASGTSYGHDSIRYDNNSYFGDTKYGHGEQMAVDATETRSVRRVRVIERQHYRYVPSWTFVNPSTGDLRRVPETWSDERMQVFAQRNGLMLDARVSKKVRWTVTADRILLHDGWSPYKTFTIVPYFCYFRRGKPFGMVANLISPQEQLNKVSSQELHIVNTTANSGWIFETGSLIGMTGDDLVARGAETGLVLEVAPNRAPPQKIQPNQIPSGLDRIATKAQDNIRVISAISDALQGLSSPEVSGVALDNKERRGQVQIQKPLDNLARTRRMVGAKVLELVQQFYTEQRTLQITNEWAPGEPSEELIINERNTAGKLLNNLTLGEYQVVITSIPSNETFDDLMFSEAMQLRQAGINIPDHRVIKYSHLPNRDELSQESAQLNGFGQPTPEEQQIQQIQQQLQLRAQQAEVSKLEGEVAELQSQVQLNMAKAQQLGESGQLETAKMIMELEKKRTEMDLRKQLAHLSSQTQITKQQMSGETRLVGDAMTRFTQTQTPQNGTK